jgi:hypothetical protein
MSLPLLHDKVAETISDKLAETTSDKVAEGACRSCSTSSAANANSCSITSGVRSLWFNDWVKWCRTLTRTSSCKKAAAHHQIEIA